MKLEKLDDFLIKSCKKAKLIRIKSDSHRVFIFSNFHDIYYDYNLNDYVICFRNGYCINDDSIFAENSSIFGIMLTAISDIEFSFT